MDIYTLQRGMDSKQRPIQFGKSAKDQSWQRAGGSAFSAPSKWLTSLLFSADTMLHELTVLELSA